MKIAFIYDVIYPYVKGGAEKRNWELARRLADKGHEVHIFGMKSWDGPRCIMESGVCLHGICKFRKLYLDSGIRDIRQVLYFSISVFLPLAREKFDIIDCCAFPYLPFFPVRLISRFRKTPLVVTWQEVWGDYWYGYLGYFKGSCARVIERLVIRLSRKVIVHSGKIKKNLIACGFKGGITVIPHGIDYRLIEDTPVSSEASELIFAGRLIRDKNVDIVLRSVAKIRDTLPDVKCLIVGEGPEKEKLFKLRDELRLGKNVIFVDFLPYQELIGLMKSSKVFIFPSSREGFGLIVIEAMACGLPVVTIEHPLSAAQELLKEGENGFKCRLRPEEIASRVRGLLMDNNTRKSFIDSAKETAKGYSWDKAADSSEAFYLGLVNKNTRKP